MVIIGRNLLVPNLLFLYNLLGDKVIFSPVKISNNFLNHCIVLAPMCRFRSNSDATISDIDVEYYKQKATEGGLFISEPSFIPKIAGGYHQSLKIYNTEQTEAWKQVLYLRLSMRKRGLYICSYGILVVQAHIS